MIGDGGGFFTRALARLADTSYGSCRRCGLSLIFLFLPWEERDGPAKAYRLKYGDGLRRPANQKSCPKAIPAASISRVLLRPNGGSGSRDPGR
jgi:hypothetical protein